jgi:hypothetical protein
MSRAKNTATVQDVARLLRAEGTTLVSSKFLHADIEVVVSNYERFMVQYLKFTPRPVESQLKAAALEVYGETADAGEIPLFAQRLQSAFSYCKQKAGQMVSGKKLHASVYAVAAAFDAWKQKPGSVSAIPPKASSSSSKGASLSDLEAKLPVRSPSPRRPADKSRMPSAFSPCPALAQSPDRVKRLRTALEDVFGSLPSGNDAVIDLDGPMSSKGTISIEASPPAVVKQKGREYLDSCKLCLVRLMPSGQVFEAVMKPGPKGFALAFFSDDNGKAIETELPNLMLAAKGHAVMKKPAGRGGKSSNNSRVEDESGEAVAAESVPGSPELIAFSGLASDTNDEEDAEEEDATEDEEVEVPPAMEALAQPPPPAQEAAEPGNPEGLFKGTNLIVVYAALQSYIQEKLPTGKKRLVVAVAKTQSENNRVIIKSIFETLKEKSLFDKASALRLRIEALH